MGFVGVTGKYVQRSFGVWNSRFWYFVVLNIIISLPSVFFFFPKLLFFASFVCFLSGGEVEFRPLFLKLRLTKITFFDMKNTWYLVGMYIWAFWGYCSTVFFVCVCAVFVLTWFHLHIPISF